MSDGLKSWIELLTSWILTAFSIFVPKRTVGRMGTVFFERRIETIQPLPLNKFSPTSENFFSFPPLPTACCLLPTAFWAPLPKTQCLVRARQPLVRSWQCFVRPRLLFVRRRRLLVRIGPTFTPMEAGLSRPCAAGRGRGKINPRGRDLKQSGFSNPKTKGGKWS